MDYATYKTEMIKYTPKMLDPTMKRIQTLVICWTMIGRSQGIMIYGTAEDFLGVLKTVPPHCDVQCVLFM